MYFCGIIINKKNMKNILLLLCFFAGFSFIQAQEQYNDSKGFSAGFAPVYLTEIESIGGSVDLLYQIDQKWSFGNTTLFTVMNYLIKSV